MVLASISAKVATIHLHKPLNLGCKGIVVRRHIEKVLRTFWNELPVNSVPKSVRTEVGFPSSKIIAEKLQQL